MAERKPDSRRFRFRGVRLRESTWHVMEKLKRSWQRMNRTEVHYRQRRALISRGLAEFQMRERSYMRARLTPVGVEFRDAIYVQSASRLSRRVWGDCS